MTITITIDEALIEMSNYVKFLEEVIAGKRIIGEDMEILECRVIHRASTS